MPVLLQTPCVRSSLFYFILFIINCYFITAAASTVTNPMSMFFSSFYIVILLTVHSPLQHPVLSPLLVLLQTPCVRFFSFIYIFINCSFIAAAAMPSFITAAASAVANPMCMFLFFFLCSYTIVYCCYHCRSCLL